MPGATPPPRVPGADPALSQPGPTFADLAGLVLAAPMVAVIKPKRATPLPPERAPGLAPGATRFYVEAELTALLRATGGQPRMIRYLVDLPAQADGRAARRPRDPAIVFARSVPGRPGEVQLVAPDSQLPHDPALEARLRALIAAALAPDAPPVVTGVREALHVPGNLSGEGETQIFLSTRSGDPVSVTVVRRPGQAPVWGVALSEIVDQAARPPEPDTLTWYALACALPASLPVAAMIGSTADAQARAQEDYRFVRAALGACRRSRPPVPPTPQR